MQHPIGTFCFAELLTPDPEGAARFYGDIFGWTLAPRASGYSVFQLHGQTVVGVRHGAGATRWAAYVRVDSADAMAERALGMGGRLVQPPADTPGAARTSLAADPEGAVVGLWEPRGIDGTAVDNGPGSLWWVELATGGMTRAVAYYTSLFSWGSLHTHKFDNGEHGYTLFKLGDRSTCGVFQFEPEWGLEPAWQVYFEVASFDATAAHACALGGQQGFWRDAPNAGRIGVIVDPAGAEFLIAQPLASGS